MTSPATPLERDRESGAFSFYAIGVVMVLALVIGLLVDGSSKIQAINDAQSAAQEAGRAAGQNLTPDAITGRAANVDPGQAAVAAQSYLAQAGVDGSVSVSGTTITITTNKSWSPRLIPIGGGSVHGHATVDTQRVNP